MAKRKSNSVGGLSTGIDNTRLDVVVTGQDSDSVVTLQLSTWSDTGGWRVQKTIPLAARQLSQLQRLLAQARNAITDRQTGAGTAAAQVIPIGARRAAAPSLPAAPARRKTKKAAN